MKLKNIFFILAILHSWQTYSSEQPAAPTVQAQIAATTPPPIPMPRHLLIPSSSPGSSGFISPATQPVSRAISPSSMRPIEAGLITPPPTPQESTSSKKARSAAFAQQLSAEIEVKVRAELEPRIRSEIEAQEAKKRQDLLAQAREEIATVYRIKYEKQRQQERFKDIAFSATFGTLLGIGFYALWTAEPSEANQE